MKKGIQREREDMKEHGLQQRATNKLHREHMIRLQSEMTELICPVGDRARYLRLCEVRSSG